MTRVASNIAATLVLLCAATCALAQNAGSGKSTGQSRLHITVQVVPMVITPAPASKTLEGNAIVSYHMPIKREHMSVTEELHFVWLVGESGRPERCWLKTITVVPE
jgi:hypothetical protein